MWEPFGLKLLGAACFNAAQIRLLLSEPSHPGARVARLPPLQDQYRNQGGFHMIASGRDKIETPEQLAAGPCRSADGLCLLYPTSR